VGAVSSLKARAPVTGGNFGVWGGMFSSFDCAVKGIRQKEDAWNAIISGFMTGGCLAARSATIISKNNYFSLITLAFRWS
jgi:mitochondrial import inner membrane translocase subunit TIM17